MSNYLTNNMTKAAIVNTYMYLVLSNHKHRKKTWNFIHVIGNQWKCNM